MSTVRLYLPAIVLMIWAALWAAGLQGDAVLGFFIALLTFACVVHTDELVRRHDRNGA